MKLWRIVLAAAVLVTNPAAANSYLKMITTPPEGYEAVRAEKLYPPTAPLWYDSRIQSTAPVVTSPLPKYLAWKQAKAYEDSFRYVRDETQDVINFLSGAVVARLAYDIWGPHHRHHLLGK